MSAAAAAASVYVMLIPVVTVAAAGIVCDRYFTRQTVYSLTYSTTVHYKQHAHAAAALAAVSSFSALALLLLLHPQSPLRSSSSLHPAISHALLVTRTLASSAIIVPCMGSVARLTAPYALPLTLSAMWGGEVAVALLQLDGVCTGAVWDVLGGTVWVGVAAAAAELLLCCCMNVP